MLSEVGQDGSDNKGQRFPVGLSLRGLETALARIPEQRFNLAVLALYVLAVGVTMLAHEMWFDEIQAWLIARDSHGIANLIHNLHYEGHPALWYLLLMPLTRVTRDPAIMQGLQLLLATAAMAVILWRAPFSHLERLVLPFGHFVLFEYGVKSRCYALGFLLLVLFCSLWRERRKHPVLMAVLLAALANVHLYFAFASAAALTCLVVDRILGDAPGVLDRSSDRHWNVLAVLILCTGWALAAAVALPPADSGFAMGWSFGLSGERILAAARALGELVGVGRWPGPIAAVLVLAIILPRFRNNPAAAAFLLVSSGGILTFTYAKLALTWSQGIIFLCFLATVWIDRAGIDPRGAKAGKSAFLVPPGLFVAVLAIQALVGLGVALQDIARPYSNGSAVARFIRERGWAADPIVGIPDIRTCTVVGYLQVDRIYYANGRRWGSFAVWDRKRLEPVDIKAVMRDVDQFGPAVTIIAAEDARVDAAELGRHGFQEVARFEGAIVSSEDYVIYHR